MLKSIFFVLSIGLSLSSLYAREEIIFDVNTHNALERFNLFLETKEETQRRPGITTSADGIIGKPGDGNFTAYKFIDLQTDKWTLRVVFEIPSGVRYSNSGIYLLYNNPQIDFQKITESSKVFFQEAIKKANVRREKYGPGPFELDFFSHELQIIAGTDSTIPLENHGTAAFYGVEEGVIKGTQQIINPQLLTTGETYEITLVNDGLLKKSFIRNINTENVPMPVAEFENLSSLSDPVRGGSPIAILLQGFYNNGQDVKLPVFKRISIDLN